jgi:hypothetical protein
MRPLSQLLTLSLLSLAIPETASAERHDDDDDAINLVCFGQGEKIGSEYKSRMKWDKYDHKYRTESGYETGMQGFDTAVTLQLYGNDGRIRLPKKLIPPIHGGGDDQHWWQLENIQTSHDEIRASYKLNGMNHPKLRIDRTTGEITIKGFGQDFQGRCDKVDEGERRF